MVCSWVYQAFCGPQQNQPNTKKLKQLVLMKHVRRKKQPVLKSDMRWKGKKERTSETANCISLQKRRYILCRKTLFTTKHKTLKRQKKAKRQHLKTMDCDLFFCWSNSFLFFRKKMYINGGVKKKRYQRWGEKCNNFFGNFFIILASTTNFVQNLNLLWPTKISLKTLFFRRSNMSFCSRSKIFFSHNVEGFALTPNTQCCCCKWFQFVAEEFANDFRSLQRSLQMACSWLQNVLMTFAND